MRAVGGHVRWLIEEPDAFPLVGDRPQIFGGEDELLGPADRITRIHRDEAAGAHRERHGRQQNPAQFPHHYVLHDGLNQLA